MVDLAAQGGGRCQRVSLPVYHRDLGLFLGYRQVRVARALLELLLTHASPPGLHAGQIDPNSGRHLGNSPKPSRTSP
jgi:hypothetical protein